MDRWANHNISLCHDIPFVIKMSDEMLILDIETSVCSQQTRFFYKNETTSGFYDSVQIKDFASKICVN